MKDIIEKLGITKEPWKGLHGEGVDKRGNKKVFAGDLPICTIRVTDNDTGNCQLIATAPEMLEALIDALYDIELLYEKIGSNFKSDYKKHIAIIQKATNKSWEEIKELI